MKLKSHERLCSNCNLLSKPEKGHRNISMGDRCFYICKPCVDEDVARAEHLYDQMPGPDDPMWSNMLFIG